MTEYVSIQSSRDVIQHFGIKGMKWGRRKSKEFYTKKYIGKGYNPRAAREKAEKRMVLNKRLKTGAKIAGGVALAGLATYGAYKGYGHLKSNYGRIAAENLATRQRMEASRESWERVKDADRQRRELSELRKRGAAINNLYSKRTSEAQALAERAIKRAGKDYKAPNIAAMSTAERIKMLNDITKRNREYVKSV